MKIAIGSDKSGFAAKEAVKAYLVEAGVEFDDLGTTDLGDVHPYYQVASEVAPLVQNGTYEKAVLICGTGAGMSVVSNKYKGVYAVACEGVYSAKMARAINNANVLCMGGWIVGPEMAVEMVKTFLLYGRLDRGARDGRGDGEDLPYYRLVPGLGGLAGCEHA